MWASTPTKIKINTQLNYNLQVTQKNPYWYDKLCETKKTPQTREELAVHFI